MEGEGMGTTGKHREGKGTLDKPAFGPACIGDGNGNREILNLPMFLLRIADRQF